MTDLPTDRTLVPALLAPPAPPSPTRRRWLVTALSVATAASMGGCVIAPPGYAYRQPAPGPMVDAEPPPPQYEVVPAAPGLGYVWIGGYWGWNLGRHVWIGGRWALPPHGHGWVPGYWGRAGRGWHWQGGYWGRHR
jgi:hypothetical protein